MSNNLEYLDFDDVIAITSDNKSKFIAGSTLKTRQLSEEYKKYVINSNVKNNNSTIFDNSIECEVLRHDNNSQGWRKGKIKFVVQFEPKEVENSCEQNSLDDIRQQLDSTN